MERTTIYLDDHIRRRLLEISAEESKKEGKHIGMAKVIRQALVEYLEKHGKIIEKPITDRETTAKSNLGEDIDKRLENVQRELTDLQKEIKILKKGKERG